MHYAERNQEGWMQEVQRMPVVRMRNKTPKQPKTAKEKKKAKLAAAKAKGKADAKAKADPKKKTKKTKADKAGDSSESPALSPDATDLKSQIAVLEGEVNKYKQQAETARAKIGETPIGATKPTSKNKICNHFSKGNHCSYGDKCNFVHCNPNDPDRKPLPNHPKGGAGADWPPPVSPKKANAKPKAKGKAKTKQNATDPKAKGKAKSEPKKKGQGQAESEASQGRSPCPCRSRRRRGGGRGRRR